MGRPAARAGDTTAHGAPLGPGGCPTVVIAGQPAWRAGVDAHVCPMMQGALPHVGGVVAVGSASVHIGGAPAVCQGDVIVETVAQNVIIGGAPTVLIG